MARSCQVARSEKRQNAKCHLIERGATTADGSTIMGKRVWTAQQLGRKGGQATAKNHTKEERSERARHAAKAMWAKRKAAEKATV